MGTMTKAEARKALEAAIGGYTIGLRKAVDVAEAIDAFDRAAVARG